MNKRWLASILGAVTIVLVCAGAVLHSHAATKERVLSHITVVSDSAAMERLTVVPLSKISFEVSRIVPPPFSQGHNSNAIPISSVINRLTSDKQITMTKESHLFATLVSSSNLPTGNVPGLSDPVWVVVCTGQPVGGATFHGGPFFSRTSALSRLWKRATHQWATYFGLPPYPKVWSIWVCSDTTGQLIENMVAWSGAYFTYTH